MSVKSFQEIQTLISQFGSIHNVRVREYFRTSNSDQSEIAKQRAFLGVLLTINPARDNLIACIFKFLFFYMVAGSAFEGMAKVYGTPIRQFQSDVAFQPQVMIIFKEREINKADLPLRKYRLQKEISFRLQAEKVPKNKAELKTLANKCRLIFFPSGKAFSYTAGLTSYRYTDEEGGYRLSIDSNSKTTALALIDKALDVQGRKYQASKLKITNFEKSTPEKITVLGTRVDKPTRGRVGKLYCYEIQYHQTGLAPRILVNGLGVVPF